MNFKELVIELEKLSTDELRVIRDLTLDWMIDREKRVRKQLENQLHERT